MEQIIRFLEDNRKEVVKNNLINTKKRILGISFPVLTKLTRGLKQEEIIQMINDYDDSSFELSIYTSMLIGKIKDFNIAFNCLKNFIKYVDNWATSDKLSQAFRIIRKNTEYKDEILDFLLDSNPWKVRVGLIIILSHLINDIEFEIIYSYIDQIKSEGYYVDMGIAWLLAEMASIDSRSVLNYLKNAKINTFTNNKTLSKMRDSFKIDKDIKEETYLYKR